MRSYFFNLSFYEQALLIGSLVAVATALLSPFLVLRKQALIADGISHASFFGFTVGALFSSEPIYIALIIAIISALIMKFIMNHFKIAGDAAIGVMATTGLALGLIVINTKSFNLSFEVLMQGSILTASNIDLVLALAFTILIGGFVIINYRDLFALCFDSNYTKFNNVKANYLDYVLIALTSSVIVVGIRIMGALLITALIIFPTLIAVRFRTNFLYTLIIAVVSSLLAINTGLIVTGPFALALPPTPVIVLAYLLFLIGALIYQKTIIIIRRNKHENSYD